MAKKIKAGALLTKKKHLDLCPEGTIIQDHPWRGDVWQKAWGVDDGMDVLGWWRAGDTDLYESAEWFEWGSPVFCVLYVPQVDF